MKSEIMFAYNLFCPLCGSPLKQTKTSEETGHREEFACTKEDFPCFEKDYPLYFHHPFGGPESSPGDSWSLSWVK